MIRRLILALPVGLAAFGALAFLQPKWALDTLARASDRVIFFYETEQPVIALTIDDGPAEGTAAILSSLSRHGAKATFFLITSRIQGREQTIQQLVDDGHEIANHLTREQASILLGAEQFEHELKAAQAALLPFSDVRWFRPGSGWYSSSMLDTVERHGLHTALGSIYPFDTYLRSPELIAGHVLARIEPGAVIVMHDAEGRGHRTAEALDLILPALMESGYQVTTLSALEAVAAEGNR